VYHNWSFSEAKRFPLSTLWSFLLFCFLFLFLRINVVSRTMQHSTFAHEGAERRFIWALTQLFKFCKMIFVSNTYVDGQINVSFVEWRCLGVCRQIVGFCRVVISSSGQVLNWHWRWSVDQFSIQWWTRTRSLPASAWLCWVESKNTSFECLLLSRCEKKFDCTVVMSSRLNSYQLFRTRIVPGIETLSHLNSYRSEFVQWYSPIVFNFTGFTGSQSWNIDNLIDT